MTGTNGWHNGQFKQISISALLMSGQFHISHKENAAIADLPEQQLDKRASISAVKLDIIDSRLIAELQKNNRVSVTELCDTIGLTPATCHRRLKRLRESGIIIKETALVDPRLTARPLTVIMEITLAHNRIAFEKKLSGLKEISMCWAVSGPVDFVAVGQFRDINHYRDFMLAELIHDENVKRQNSAIVVDRLRFNLELEFPVET